jgi:peptidoglycan/xylan/chitin deacetylase (PgdA/CDA1 family)
MDQVQREIAQKRLLVLTYDDGPSGTVTPQLLDLLRARKAQATFFMLGQNAAEHPGIADRVVREGHDIGCHSARHLNAWKSLPWNAVADVSAGYEQLSSWIAPNAMFRPPYGKMILPTYLEVRHRRASVWWWTIDSGDTDKVLPKAADVIERVRKQGGGIVLMHDLDRTAQRTEFVLQLTAGLLDAASQEKLQVVPLRELCR